MRVLTDHLYREAAREAARSDNTRLFTNKIQGKNNFFNPCYQNSLHPKKEERNIQNIHSTKKSDLIRNQELNSNYIYNFKEK